MRRNVKILSVGLLVLFVAFGAMACKKREPVTSSSIVTNTGGAAAVQTQAAEVTSVKGTVEAKGGSNVTGTAELSPGTPGTKVVVTVKGLTGNQYVAYIYHGSCDGAGERHGPLSAFQADGDNFTSTTNFISLALNHFAGEPHFLVIHTGTSDNVGTAVACAELKNAS
ncbi:MAG: hypothetical protein K1X87_05845 [Dehalococcoidia bacterium]|nr:hypothetical protein [Dehalococcoidia bacterium]